MPSKPRRFDRDVDGILLLDKPVGITSNAALQKVRVLYRAVKAGHAGSLDPMASGMLPICFGQATKVCAFLLDASKAYRFIVRLGERTDTGDADGAIVERRAIPTLTEKQIDASLQAMLGEQQQVPPMYSALKHEGQRLYELARRGEEVERAPRHIVVKSLVLKHFSGDEIEIELHCSKGTYVRTFAEDFAVRVGTVGHLTMLRRLQVDPFTDRAMVTIEQLQSSADQEFAALDSLLIPADQALAHLRAVQVDGSGELALLHGQTVVGGEALLSGELVRLYGPEHHFLGLGEAGDRGAIQPRRLFVRRQLIP
jgi:tRNA pseudouridine55 synthase